MDCAKTGAVISGLHHEKGDTYSGVLFKQALFYVFRTRLVFRENARKIILI